MRRTLWIACTTNAAMLVILEVMLHDRPQPGVGDFFWLGAAAAYALVAIALKPEPRP